MTQFYRPVMAQFSCDSKSLPFMQSSSISVFCIQHDFMELRTLGKGNWGEVLEVACSDSIGELHTYALKKALVPASAAAAPDAAPAGGQAVPDVTAEPAARAAVTFCGALAKPIPEESGALDLPGAGQCITEEEAAPEADKEAVEEADLAGVEEVELWDTREVRTIDLHARAVDIFLSHIARQCT